MNTSWSTEYALQRVRHICKGTYIGHSEKCERTFIPIRTDIFICNSCALMKKDNHKVVKKLISSKGTMEH